MGFRCKTSSSTVSTGPTRCGCGDKLLLLISKSETNPGRKFWRCPNWKTPNTCNFFSWADKKEIPDIDTTAAEASQSFVASDLLHEEWRRKNMKL